MRLRSVERLVAKLRMSGYSIPAQGWSFHRCYPGHWQRAAGAWSWMIRWENGEIGSSDSVAACLKAKTITDGKWNEINAGD